jgi:three-Cys-motif partner protein
MYKGNPLKYQSHEMPYWEKLGKRDHQPFSPKSMVVDFDKKLYITVGNLSKDRRVCSLSNFLDFQIKHMDKVRFFEETTEQSLIKAKIVSKYFRAWARVILPSAKKYSGKIAYVDLFAGPGRYKNGTKSTPLMILEDAIKDEELRKMLVTIFNDIDRDFINSLESEINSLPGINTLNYQPKILTEAVGDKIAEIFEHIGIVPTLLFIDPWGYKGLSLKLINSVLKDWGCDCIFFFNYNRIKMGLNNLLVKEHMNALFGRERADVLRTKLKGMNPTEQEFAILEEIVNALKEMGGKYVLPFGFKNEQGTRTSHHLIFVSKNIRGYEIMKGIMAKESSSANSGVPSFEYNPATTRFPTLFEFSRPLKDLEKMLLSDFAGRTLRMKKIYLEHNVGKPYISKNYKDVLRKMEIAGKISVDPPAPMRLKRKGEVSFGDDVLVTFPFERSK